jgi:hypothetical protein
LGLRIKVQRSHCAFGFDLYTAPSFGRSYADTEGNQGNPLLRNKRLIAEKLTGSRSGKLRQ